MQKRVKIVATVGPASETKLPALFKAGVDCLRINTAYRDTAYYEKIIKTVRRIGNYPVLLDLKGSDIRFRTKKELSLKKGDLVEVGFLKGAQHFTKNFLGSLKKGDHIYFKDGRYKSIVASKDRGKVVLKIQNRTTLYDGIGVNIPQDLNLKPLLSTKDKQVIKLARKLDVEYVALSFTKDARDVKTLRRALGDESIKIIAKIESAQGVRNIESILAESDGIMVARGDLGIELPDEQVPILQKQLIRAANNKGKIVITATEMMESMIENNRPTRAETSDIANAVLDGTDAVMLSAETASGKYPVAAVREMSQVILASQSHIHNHIHADYTKVSELVSASVSSFCQQMDLAAIVTITRSGFTARMVSRFRNNEPIIAVTREAKVARQLHLSYGVIPVYFSKMPVSGQIRSCLKKLLAQKYLKKSDRVIVTAGNLTKRHGTNSMTVVDLADL